MFEPKAFRVGFNLIWCLGTRIDENIATDWWSNLILWRKFPFSIGFFLFSSIVRKWKIGICFWIFYEWFSCKITPNDLQMTLNDLRRSSVEMSLNSCTYQGCDKQVFQLLSYQSIQKLHLIILHRAKILFSFCSIVLSDKSILELIIYRSLLSYTKL